MKKYFVILVVILAGYSDVMGQWEQCYGSFLYNVHFIVSMNKNLLAGTDHGILLSTNNGDIWTKKSAGLIAPSVHSIAVGDDLLLVSTDFGIFISYNNAESWNSKNNGLPEYSLISAISINKDLFFALTSNNFYISYNKGENW